MVRVRVRVRGWVRVKYKSEVKRTKSAPHGSRRVSVTDEVVADPSQVGG